MTGNKKVRRRRSHKPDTSQHTLNKRMREVWIDGFGLYPFSPDAKTIDRIRIAMKELVSDSSYWEGLKKLCNLKGEVGKLTEVLKREL
jgi:hypothetical protein